MSRRFLAFSITILKTSISGLVLVRRLIGLESALSDVQENDTTCCKQGPTVSHTEAVTD